MRFQKTIFFEIPQKDFLLPIYKEEDINILKTFLQDDEVCFSIGLKSLEDENGNYYVGQVKNFTDIFRFSDFPIIYRKRVSDVLEGLLENPKIVTLEVEPQILKRLVYFVMTKSGPKVYIDNYNEKSMKKLKQLNVDDYYVKDVPILQIKSYNDFDNISKNEIFYQLKNPNYM